MSLNIKLYDSDSLSYACFVETGPDRGNTEGEDFSMAIVSFMSVNVSVIAVCYLGSFKAHILSNLLKTSLLTYDISVMILVIQLHTISHQFIHFYTMTSSTTFDFYYEHML